MSKVILILKWIVGPLILIGGAVYLFIKLTSRGPTVEAFGPEFEALSQKIDEETKTEALEKTVQFLNKWFFSGLIAIVLLTGCGFKTLIIPEPPAVPQIEFLINEGGKVEIEPYEAKALKIYIEKHELYRKKLFELFDKL